MLCGVQAERWVFAVWCSGGEMGVCCVAGAPGGAGRGTSASADAESQRTLQVSPLSLSKQESGPPWSLLQV